MKNRVINRNLIIKLQASSINLNLNTWHQLLHKFCARNTSLLTISGFSAALLHVTTLPPVLNALSEGELVAGMHTYFFARQLTRGKSVAHLLLGQYTCHSSNREP